MTVSGPSSASAWGPRPREGRGGLAAAGSYLADYLRQLRTGLALLGQDSLAGLTSLPLVVSGRLGEMLAGMGIDLSRGGLGT